MKEKLKRLIKHIRTWNGWRKENHLSKTEKMLVLFGKLNPLSYQIYKITYGLRKWIHINGDVISVAAEADRLNSTKSNDPEEWNCSTCRYSDLECYEQCKEGLVCTGCFGASFGDCDTCKYNGGENNGAHSL